MEQFKRAQVVMLPTECDGVVCINHNGKMFSKNYSDTKNYHLYITSDDEIKDSDYYLYKGKIYKCTGDWAGDKQYQISINKYDFHKGINCKKIIATTYTSLNKYCWNCNLLKENATGLCIRCGRFGDTKRFISQPSQQFITKYIEEYNKGNIITNVLIEYKDKGREDVFENWIEKEVLKINPKDNTITIKKLKDSWNREELDIIIQRLLYKSNDLVTYFPDGTIRNINTDNLNKWKNKYL